MQNPFVHKAGGVVSADIAVHDHERELSFYSSILTTGDDPLWREDLLNNLGAPVIGLGKRTPEYEALPLQWMPHFQVTDIAGSVEKAVAMGGKDLWHSKTEDGQSQWAAIVDPEGVGVGLIPVVTDEADSGNSKAKIGRIAGLSLFVPDASTSLSFYQEVVGWQSKPAESKDSQDTSSFEMLLEDGTVAAEIIQQNDNTKDVPPAWLLHLPVDNFDKSLELVDEHGGKVVVLSGDRKYAIVRDPIGVHFVIQPDQSQ